MSHKVTVINEENIPSSNGCFSLFLNGKFIVSADRDNKDTDIEFIARNLADTLGCGIDLVALSQGMLAQFLLDSGRYQPKEGEIIGNLEGFDGDFITTGYTNDDLEAYLASR